MKNDGLYLNRLTSEIEKETLESKGHSEFVLRAFAALFNEIDRLRQREKDLIELYEDQRWDYDRVDHRIL